MYFNAAELTWLNYSYSQREDSAKITIQATGATSWRRADVKYRKNEAFVDVIETVNLLMSKEGMKSRTAQHVQELNLSAP